VFNPLNAELNPICRLLALLGGATIVVVSRLRVKFYFILGYFMICFVHITMYTGGVMELTRSVS
jgi:hypothetical protein